ncbi:helix-turn-helix transcriptional regulator, partial [Monoglobus pectinilyticus]
MSIGSNIKYYRELHHLTQKELAEAIGVSDKAVSTWENDKKIPRMGVIQKMADFFNIQKTNIIEDSPNLVTNKVLNSSINTIVAVNLKKIRADKMLRYADISALSGVTKEDLQAFEEGTKRPKSADIRNIELALDLEK